MPLHSIPLCPLLKIPLLITHAVCTWWSATPPRPPPPVEEQKHLPAPDVFSNTLPFLIHLVTACKWVYYGAALAEITVLVAQHLPNSSIADSVVSFLLQTPDASLQLTTLSCAACMLGILGGLLRIWCYRTLGEFFTWEASVQREHKLITDGPYAIVRHPSYTGAAMMNAGNFLLLLSEGSYVAEAGWLRNSWGRAVVFGVIGYMSYITYSLIRRAVKEDAMLEKEFGLRWQQWAKRTPYRIVPHVY
ncbi:ICMT-domain-containing protein [Cubamyces sp. BRFM 1775]|nr:ICMT-domain-containing protein [Cubamyces sp. BRFM 1775]